MPPPASACLRQAELLQDAFDARGLGVEDAYSTAVSLVVVTVLALLESRDVDAITIATPWVLSRTRFGLRVRAAGENPEAVTAVGLSVTRIRCLALIVSAVLIPAQRELHDRIGHLLESLPGEANAERSALLAHHYTRSENRDKAIIYALLKIPGDAFMRGFSDNRLRNWPGIEVGALRPTPTRPNPPKMRFYSAAHDGELSHHDIALLEQLSCHVPDDFIGEHSPGHFTRGRRHVLSAT